MVDRARRWAARWLLPWRCTLCGAAGLPGLDLCTACHADLPWNLPSCPGCAQPMPPGTSDWRCGSCLAHPPAWDAAFSPLRYALPVDTLIQQLKFQGQLARARLLGDLMAATLASSRRTPWPKALIPVPLHPTRLRERGFNQARELALRLARLPGVRLCDDLARRTRATPPQVGLTAAARARNLRGAFAVDGAVPDHVALIDDVLTTGGTLTALSLALRAAGASRIEVWTVARSAPDPQETR
ncbi:MAG TPA: ComF family protein [Candidatus Acidoferrales bacterium]|nr:ComF family protein [Candidatus Acidoferrales bacterium]